MNFNISFSSFQETGQTGTKHLLNLVQYPDDTALNKHNDQVTLFPIQFSNTALGAFPDHYLTWISLLLKIHEYGW